MGKNVKLNANDTKNTLATQKKKTKAPKLVLVNNLPEFWPVLNDEQLTKFLNIIER